MNLAFITPIQHISDIASYSTYHLLLAHLVKYPAYVEAYKQLKLQNGNSFFILDNSAFELERAYPNDLLLEAAHVVNADEVIAPEIMGDMKGTIEKVQDFISFAGVEGWDKRIGAVLQGRSFKDFLKCFAAFHAMDDIQTICIPMLDPPDAPYKHVRSYTTRVVLNRILFCQIINQKFDVRKPVHLLGLTDGIELEVQRKHKWIRGNDSSSAFIHGYFGHRYTDRGLPCEKISTKMDFNWLIKNDAQRQCIIHNIQMLKQFAGI